MIRILKFVWYRWIRFEEQAESVLGRWSKPHVATLPHTAIDDLDELLVESTLMFDLLLGNILEIADAVANELLDTGYLETVLQARQLAEVLCLSHRHHHLKAKKPVTSSNPLSSTNGRSSNNLFEHQPVAESTFDENKQQEPQKNDNQLNVESKKKRSQLRQQLSFTDMIASEDVLSAAGAEFKFKENTKFKKKVHTKAEGASVMVMPVHVSEQQKNKNTTDRLGYMVMFPYDPIDLKYGPHQVNIQKIKLTLTL